MKRLLTFTLCCVPFWAKADIATQCLASNPNLKIEETIADCEQAILIDQNPPSLRADILLQLGLAERAAGNYDASEAHLIAASNIIPNDGNILRMLAWTLRESGKPSAAERVYTQVLEFDNHWQGWLSRCVVRQDMDEFSLSLSDCKEALYQENNTDTLYFTARALVGMEDYKEALDLLSPSILERETSSRTHYLKVIALWNSGRRGAARVLVRQGLKRFPNDADLLSLGID